MERKQFIVDSTLTGRKKKVYKYRFSTRYKDALGRSSRYYSKWFDSKEECHEAELLFRTKKEHPSNGAFREICQACIDDKEKRNAITQRTKREQERFLNEWFEPLHTVPIGEVTPLMIEQILDKYIDQYSTGYVKKAKDLLNTTFKFAMRKYGLESNPMDRIDRILPKDEEQLTEMTIWSADQFAQFMEFVPDDKEVYKVFYLILFWTGLRKNEALSLTWKDFDGKRLRVYRQWQDGRWSTLKTKKSIRTIQIDGNCINALNSLKKNVQDDEYFSLDWFIFGGPKQISTTHIDRIKQAAIEKAGLPYIRIHDFRHSHASYLISKGVNMYTVSRRLGHSSIQMTIDRYTHLLPSAEDEVINAITG